MKPASQRNSWIEAVGLLSKRGQPYVLITILGSRGSTPRESGTKMVVGHQEFFGSIGGGHLEFKALEIAAEMLASGCDAQRVEHLALGASLGQCCGGRLTLLFESFAANRCNIAVFGAGHVGKVLTDILQQLPCRLHWLDSREGQFPEDLPANVCPLTCSDPAAEVGNLPVASYYLIMTHSHQQDFEILEAVLKRSDARYVGLIGSETKWRRFQLRLEYKGYAPEDYRDVHCPVGLPQVPGKLPAEVAVSIAGQVIAEYHADDQGRPSGGDVAQRDLKYLVGEDAALPTGD